MEGKLCLPRAVEEAGCGRKMADIGRRQDPEMPQTESASTASTTERQLLSPLREDENQLEHLPLAQSWAVTVIGPTFKKYLKKYFCVFYKGCRVIKEIREKNNITDKTKIFNDIMKSSSNKNTLPIDSLFGDKWLYVLLYYLKKYNIAAQSQRAFPLFLMKNGEYWIFPPVPPDHRHDHKNSTKCVPTKHSEEILIEQIGQFLDHNQYKVKRILIYSTNSPCLMLGKRSNIDCCTIKLSKESDAWHRKYGVSTDVAFTKFWGCGPDYFKDLTYDTISQPNSVFYLYFLECCFELDCKYMEKQYGWNPIFPLISLLPKENREETSKKVKNAMTKLMELAESRSLRTAQDHINQGKETIGSFRFETNIHERFLENWTKMVERCGLPPIRKKITSNFNTALVNSVYSDIMSDHLRFYHIPPEQINDFFLTK
ncbi:uncharacterized protein LOC113144869 isoform X2 [Mastacembelus armatus]|uniref:uncharacterized protein LOC113144869 isoform X2 n=1 Tax=Mastacembelus armatus TaxID=205130 RepID=UPI000E4610B6|nr:uncharacterized protein LOC113144869 isoform X2 [Mastacembelus armatus]